MAYYCHFVQQEFGPAERCHTQSLIAADVTTASPQTLLLTQMRFGANANAVSCVTRILFPSVVPWFRIYSSHKLVWSIVNTIRRQCSHHSIGLGPDDVKSSIEYRFSQSLRPDVPAGMGLTGCVWCVRVSTAAHWHPPLTAVNLAFLLLLLLLPTRQHHACISVSDNKYYSFIRWLQQLPGQ